VKNPKTSGIGYIFIGKQLDSSKSFQLKDIICYYKEDKASTSISYIVLFFFLGQILFTSKNSLNRSLLYFTLLDIIWFMSKFNMFYALYLLVI